MTMKTILFFIISIVYSTFLFPEVFACTTGVIASIASADKRPIFWKNRDYIIREQRIVFVKGSKYSYIGIGDNIGYMYMGLNEKGLAMGNTLMADLSGGSGNASTLNWLLQNFSNITECRNALEFNLYPGGKPSFSLSFLDAGGTTFVIEKGSSYYEYDPLVYGDDNVRKQPVIVRANSAHANSDGSDDSLTGGSRYIYGRNHLQNAVIREGISDTDRFDNKGVTISEVFRASRYGSPGFDDDKNSRSTTLSAIVVHGVAAGEDPSITVMWSTLSKPDYIPYIPVWYQIGSSNEVPMRLTAQNSNQSLMYLADLIYSKRDSANFDEYINKRIEPLEKNFIQAVSDARNKWFSTGFVYSEAKNICFNATETSYFTLKAVADQIQPDSRSAGLPPQIDSIHIEEKSDTPRFSVVAHDSDGIITNFFWDFGDGSFSSNPAPVHNYKEDGEYLVMCRIQDNSGMCNSSWKYVTIQKCIPPFFNIRAMPESVTFSMLFTESGSYSLDVFSLSGMRLWHIEIKCQGNTIQKFIWDHKYTGNFNKLCIAVLTHQKMKITQKIIL
jgi:hypothetical protein